MLAGEESGEKQSLKRKNGAPGRTRIPNLLIRSQTLYPIELRALIFSPWPWNRDFYGHGDRRIWGR